MANPEHERTLRDAVRGGKSSVDMSGFDLSGLLLSSVRLEGVNLSGADLHAADLSGGYLRGCNLRNARLNKARIVLGDFRDADLSGADLTAADLNGAIMTGVNLENANLTRANLVRTRLNGASLVSANVDRTDLRGVQGLTEEQLASAINSGKAILDERMLSALHRSGDPTIARHGRQPKRRAAPSQVDLTFDAEKPSFGDVFLLCGDQHPGFPPTAASASSSWLIWASNKSTITLRFVLTAIPWSGSLRWSRGRSLNIILAHLTGSGSSLTINRTKGFGQDAWLGSKRRCGSPR
jgi:hypothetical protein